MHCDRVRVIPAPKSYDLLLDKVRRTFLHIPAAAAVRAPEVLSSDPGKTRVPSEALQQGKLLNFRSKARRTGTMNIAGRKRPVMKAKCPPGYVPEIQVKYQKFSSTLNPYAQEFVPQSEQEKQSQWEAWLETVRATFQAKTLSETNQALYKQRKLASDSLNRLAWSSLFMTSFSE